MRIKSIGYGFLWGNLAWSLTMFARKRFVIWPLPVAWGLATAFYYPRFMQLHNKKFFDMCNVGEEYYLGAQRNQVLRKCNELLDREDF